MTRERILASTQKFIQLLRWLHPPLAILPSLPWPKKYYLRCHPICHPSLNQNQLVMQDVVRRRISILVSKTLYLILFKLRMHSFAKFWSLMIVKFCVSSPDWSYRTCCIWSCSQERRETMLGWQSKCAGGAFFILVLNVYQNLFWSDILCEMLLDPVFELKFHLLVTKYKELVFLFLDFIFCYWYANIFWHYADTRKPLKV